MLNSFLGRSSYWSANKANVVKTDSDTTSGVLTEATRVTLTANQDNMNSLVIGLNGIQVLQQHLILIQIPLLVLPLKPTSMPWLKH